MEACGEMDKLKFLSGVIEGFYGRPWTKEQRKKLFGWMQRMGLSVYLYAPKDDLKHRANWRDLYTPAEVSELSDIISSAHAHGVRFVFCVSPGLSITFCSEDDRKGLLAKFQQIAEIGCQCFALLFDDVDLDLGEEDAKAFPSPGLAQSDLANEIFKKLKKPQPFLFCPTEYCNSRARPCVTQSPYLRDLGNHLDNGIDILWTGPLVLSQLVSPTDLEENLVPVLQRAPVLWDNLHNNDYDMRRLHLGPLDGRPVALRCSGALRGLLANPNVQLEANFVPLHTLGQWCSAPSDAQYVRQEAHMKAVEEWMEEMYPAGSREAVEEKERLTMEDLQHLCDVFFLPYEYGPTARRYLDSARWLLSNVHQCSSSEFRDREQLLRDVAQVWKAICSKLSFLPNRELAYILLPYCFDVRFVCGAILRYIQCLKSHTQPAFVFRLEAAEAWDLRSGWFSEVENLLPNVRLESGAGLDRSLSDSAIFIVRPLLPSDERHVEEMKEALSRRAEDKNGDAKEEGEVDRAARCLRMHAGDLLSNAASSALFVLDSGGPVVAVAQSFANGSTLAQEPALCSLVGPIDKVTAAFKLEEGQSVGLLLLFSRPAAPRSALSRLAASALAPLRGASCGAVLALLPNQMKTAAFPGLQLHVPPFQAPPPSRPPVPLELWLELPIDEMSAVLDMEVVERAEEYSLCARRV